MFLKKSMNINKLNLIDKYEIHKTNTIIATRHNNYHCL